MPKFKVRVLADATVYKEVVVEADKPVDALSVALMEAELNVQPWLLPDGFQADQPYIGDPDNDVEAIEDSGLTAKEFYGLVKLERGPALPEVAHKPVKTPPLTVRSFRKAAKPKKSKGHGANLPKPGLGQW